MAVISDLFLKNGLRSTSMEDIARHLKIAKKTLYQFFDNKEDVVEQVMLYRRSCRDQNTTLEQLHKRHPLELLAGAWQYILYDLDNRYPANHYDLRRYYPKVAQKLKEEDEIFFKHFLTVLIEEGVRLGVFRADLDTEMQIYFFTRQVQYLQEPEHLAGIVYPLPRTISALIDNFVRCIATSEGVERFEKLKQNNNPL